MEAQLKGGSLNSSSGGAMPQWRCPILKPLSAKLPPKSETAPHSGWQDGTILEPGYQVREGSLLYNRYAGIGDTAYTLFCHIRGMVLQFSFPKLDFDLKYFEIHV